jgi:hypothetical protein
VSARGAEPPHGRPRRAAPAQARHRADALRPREARDRRRLRRVSCGALRASI